MATFRKVCFYCRREFEASHSLANKCSPDCHLSISTPKIPKPVLVAAKPVDLPPVKTARKAQVAKTGTIALACLRCRKAIRDAMGTRRYCSSVCRKAAQRKTRQTRVKSRYVEPVLMEVLRRRDNDTCRICGLPIDFDRKQPDPSAATIDHVIALVRGGEHSYKNTQLAHFRCNTSKGSG